MHAKYEVFISYDSKVIAKVKVDNRQTDKQTDRQTDKQTDRQRGQKQYAPDHSIRGHNKKKMISFSCYFHLIYHFLVISTWYIIFLLFPLDKGHAHENCRNSVSFVILS